VVADGAARDGMLADGMAGDGMLADGVVGDVMAGGGMAGGGAGGAAKGSVAGCAGPVGTGLGDWCSYQTDSGSGSAADCSQEIPAFCHTACDVCHTERRAGSPCHRASRGESSGPGTAGRSHAEAGCEFPDTCAGRET
jgi:hypothetical protein